MEPNEATADYSVSDELLTTRPCYHAHGQHRREAGTH